MLHVRWNPLRFHNPLQFQFLTMLLPQTWRAHVAVVAVELLVCALQLRLHGEVAEAARLSLSARAAASPAVTNVVDI